MKINEIIPGAPLTEGAIYRISGELMRCKKIRDSGINTFQVVDTEGNDLVLRDEDSPGVVVDYGIRVKRCR
jgi:hypothetical protein